MKKLILLAVLSFNAFGAVSTGDNALPKVVIDNMFCVGYNQAIYENTTENTSVNTEAEAAMEYFYNRGFKLNEKYKIDDGVPDSGGGKDTDALNQVYSLGYANYLRYRKPMPEMCFKVYSASLKGLSTEQLDKPYEQ